MPADGDRAVAVPLVVGASKSYRASAGRHRPICNGLTLSIEVGRRIGILAPNASGKSTLLRILLRLEPLDAGRVELSVTDVDRMAAVLQDYRGQLIPWAAVATNLLLAQGGAVPLAVGRTEMLETCTRLLGEIGYDIDLSQRVSDLSGGQQQAVVLARALAYRSRILIWDEPTSAIDARRRVQLHHLLLRHFRERDPVLVLATHDVDEALVLTDEAVLLGAGLKVLRRVRTCSAEFAGDLGAYRETDVYRSARAALSGWT